MSVEVIVQGDLRVVEVGVIGGGSGGGGGGGVSVIHESDIDFTTDYALIQFGQDAGTLQTYYSNFGEDNTILADGLYVIDALINFTAGAGGTEGDIFSVDLGFSPIRQGLQTATRLSLSRPSPGDLTRARTMWVIPCKAGDIIGVQSSPLEIDDEVGGSFTFRRVLSG